MIPRTTMRTHSPNLLYSRKRVFEKFCFSLSETMTVFTVRVASNDKNTITRAMLGGYPRGVRGKYPKKSRFVLVINDGADF